LPHLASLNCGAPRVKGCCLVQTLDLAATEFAVEKHAILVAAFFSAMFFGLATPQPAWLAEEPISLSIIS